MKYLKITFIVLITLLVISGCGKKYKMRRPMLDENIPAQNNISASFNLIWEQHSNDKPVGPLTVHKNHLAYPGSRNRIKFFDIITGKYLGQLKSKGTAHTGITIKDSLAYYAVSPKKSKLKCINLLSGKKVWQKYLKDASNGSIIIDNKLIIGSSEGRLTAYDHLNGDVVWSYKTESRFVQPPVADQGTIYQVGDNGSIYGISESDGREKLVVELNQPITAPPVIGDYLFVSTMNGIVYALDYQDGSILWQTDISGPIWSSPSLMDDKLVIGHSSGEVVALNAADGNVLWRFNAVDVIKAPVLVANELVIFGTLSSKLFSLKLSNGQMLDSLKLDGQIKTGPVTNGHHIIVATEKGKIFCFGENNEAVTTDSQRVASTGKSK